ncbi:hypothetical protein KEF85_10435 [Methylomonas paludis]|uniref:Uncharacterized protein n=1 Tax=Methylomonas paludis TaxID=1173101 RepID=A0A975MLX0_9GAMM|nr:hypothetical protein [Methylomonas paludis]QWF69789.1 hypothetical protein KEF85_10435 [Methylomonas paludis]
MYIKKRLTENRIQPCFLKPGFAKSRAGILATILLGSTSLLSEAALATDWATTGGTLDGQRYSALNQINTTNVGTLTEDFSVDTGTKGSHMGEPLVVGSEIVNVVVASTFKS